MTSTTPAVALDGDDYTDTDFETVSKRMHFCSIGSVSMSLLTFYLIFKHSTKSMGVFKYHLMNIQMAALVMDVCLSLYFCPVPAIAYRVFCGYGFVTRHMDFFWGEVVPFYVMHFCLAYVGTTFAIGIMYRYFVLTDHTGIINFLNSPRCIPAIAMVVFVLPMPCLIPMTRAYVPHNETIEFVTKYAPKFLPLYLKYPCSALIDVDAMMVYGILVVGTIVALSIFVLIFAARTRDSLLIRQHQMSAKTFQIHQQLLRSIWIQCFIPFFVIIVPVCAIELTAIFTVQHIKDFVFTSFQVFAVHGIFSATVTISLISPYRNAMLAVVKTMFCFWRKTTVAASPVLSVESRTVVAS